MDPCFLLLPSASDVSYPQTDPWCCFEEKGEGEGSSPTTLIQLHSFSKLYIFLFRIHLNSRKFGNNDSLGSMHCVCVCVLTLQLGSPT